MIDIIRNWFNRYFSDPQMMLLAILLLFGFVVVFYLGEILLPVFIGVIIAYLLEGIVSALHRLRMPRIVAVTVVFIGFMACLFVLSIWLLPMLSRQIVQLLQDLPVMIANAQRELMHLPEKYPDFVTADQIRQIIRYLNTELTRAGQYLLSVSLASVKGLITFLVYLILVPLLVFFFLKDRDLILKWLQGFLPEERRLADEVWRDVNFQIGNYVRGKIWEILIVWAASYLTFATLKLPFAMLLSLFVGISVIVPYIGATVMFFPVGLIAFLEWGIGSELTTTLIALAIIQALDGNLLVPLLLSGVVNLHPVAIIFSVLLFGGLWGIWGLFFAIPLATLFQAVVKAWQTSHRERNGGATAAVTTESPTESVT